MDVELEKVTAYRNNSETESVLKKEKNEVSASALVNPPSVHMEFVDLSCSVNVGIFRKVKKKILQNISGSFSNGKLVAILGPSGSGKTTLLNTLSGYVTDNTEGQILVNGKPRYMKSFQYISSYITQESKLQELLNVREAMKYTADFKLGPTVSKREKNIKITDLLSKFNIDNCLDTRIVELSGGEKKRLSIALELINNPSIIFLDEPSSGLDSLSASQCIKYLKSLTSHGRTVVCTIHQPSASIFNQFDLIYVLSEGRCVYQGSPDCLVPYLKELDLKCPQYHNPADYVMELACREYGEESITKMVEAIGNGKISHSVNNNNTYDNSGNSQEHLAIRPNEHYQLQTLIKREYTKAKRNPSLTYLRLIVAVTNSLVLGLVFWQVGDDGSKVWFNYNGILGIILHFMMPALMLTVLAFPTEVPIIKNELFNKWYSLRVYYFSISLIDLPISILFCIISNIIIYPMTGQPMELYRFEMWFFIALLITLVAQTMGLVIGSVVNVVNGAFAASAVSFPFLMLAGFGVTYRDLNPFFYACTYLSYLRYGVEGLLGAVYGYNRKPLGCTKDTCYYKYAQTFLQDMYLSASEYWTDVMVLCVILVGLKVVAYYGLRWKVARDW